MKQLTRITLVMALATTLQSSCTQLLYKLQDSAYRRDIYPHEQTFMIDLLRRVDQVEEEAQLTYLRAVLKAFTNIAKGAQYIASSAFNQILTHVNDILTPYIRNQYHAHYSKLMIDHNLDMLDRLKAINKSILLNEFSTHYDSFKTAPVAFLDTVAEELGRNAKRELEIQELRHTIMMFLEVHLSKLIWAPEDQIETWSLTKTIANNLALFVEYDVLDDQVYLDDLYWTLTHRYCHFLDLTHEYLDYDTLRTIKRDTITGDSLLFTLEEQDTCLEKRVDCVRDTVIRVEAKKQAHEHGLI